VAHDNNDNDNDDDDDDNNDCGEYLRNGTLAILRNLLTPLLRDGGDGGKALKLFYWITAIALSENTLVQMLLEDAKVARKYPTNACLAVECLVILTQTCVCT